MQTPWGYSIDADEMPGLIDATEYDAATGGRFTGDDRVQAAIAAASAAIRNYCGWHVAPSLTCTYVTDGERGDLWLPCAALTSVESVTFDGTEQTVKGYNRLGRVRTDRPQPCGLGNVSATYTAGYDLAAVPDLLGIVVQRVTATIALGAYGVASESAGGVAISYGAAAMADKGGAFLPADVRAALAPYRLVKAHAA